MMDQACKFALIEFGEGEKTGYQLLKSRNTAHKDIAFAHAYWYPDDITQEEAECELKDLAEHYENIVILVPLPEHLNFNALNLAEESESEVSA